MKSIFIYPPLVHPGQPYMSTALLVGQLSRHGVSAKCLDLNVKYFNKILSKESLKAALKTLRVSNNSEITSFLFKNKDKIKSVLNSIEDAVSVYKTDKFYTPDTFFSAMKMLSFALELYSYKWFPTQLSFSNMKTPHYGRNFEDIAKFVNDRKTNPFIEYFENAIDENIPDDIDFIPISLPNAMQIPVALTLSKILKEKRKSKIVLGGNVINRISHVFKKHPEMFGVYFDYVLLGEGDYSICEFADYINGDITVDKVSGLMWKQNGQVFQNDIKTIKDLSKIATCDYTGVNFSEYYAPETVFPLQFAKGCDWGKCTYCGIFFGKPEYYHKTSQQIVSEIKELHSRYGADKFEFTDECIPPELFSDIADEILKLDFKINYFAMVRTDMKFTEILLKKLYKSGLRMMSWGIESDCPRILKVMNKGINRERRIGILKRANDIGMWNNTYVLFGFPSETKEEAQMTADLICNNRDIIHSYNATVYWADSKAFIQCNSTKFGLILSEKQDEFSVYLNYTDKTMPQKEKEQLHSSFIRQYIETNGFDINQIIFPDENLFLYIIKLGRNELLKWRYNAK